MYGYASPLPMKANNLEGEKDDLARRVEKPSAEYSPFYGIRQRFLLFRVGAQRSNDDRLARAFVWPLIEIAPVGKRIVGRWQTRWLSVQLSVSDLGANLTTGMRLMVNSDEGRYM